jgi:HPt (histidine-containing phosphotransfer) domain-containing protein
MIKNNVLNQIDILAKGNIDTKEKLINIFVFQTSNDIIKIKDCLQVENWNELKKVAHKLKSSFVYLKMHRPIELSETLSTKSGLDIETIKKYAKELVKICEKTVKILDENR